MKIVKNEQNKQVSVTEKFLKAWQKPIKIDRS